jgi:hypothetical protein
MYVQKKIIKTKTNFYYMTSVREGERIRQVYLKYLGAEKPSERVLKVKEKEYINTK